MSKDVDATLPARRPQAALLKGGDVVDRYVVLRCIAAGGFGVVYAAFDPQLDRKVALKVLRPELPVANQAQERALREARALARLVHPNVVAVYDAGVVDGRLFIVMELVEGDTLTAWLMGSRSWREIVDVFLRAGAGLAAAHEAGLVHRDFKPDNVLIGRDGAVRVADFGLARLGWADDTPSEPGGDVTPVTGLTQTGAVLGTPAYMAPEQHRARRDVDARADQFAFCVALYEALAGRRPFAGHTSQEVTRAIESGALQGVAPGRRLRPWLRRALRRGLRAEAAERHPSMRALLGELARGMAAPRRALLAAGAVAAVALAFGAARWTASRADVCTGAERKLAGVWDEPTTSRVRAALLASGRSHAAETAQRLTGVLDRYAADWAAMHTEACEATARRREQSEQMLDLRMGCLQRLASRLRALTGVLASRPDPEVADRALPAASSLESADECADLAALTAAVPRAPPAVRPAVEALEALLDRAEALRETGRLRDSLAVATQVVGVARALDHPQLSARALLAEARAHVVLREHAATEETSRAALALAARSGDDKLVARGWIILLGALGERGRHDEERALRLAAELAVERAGNDALLRADMLRVLAGNARLRGDLDDALRLGAQALALLGEAPAAGRTSRMLGLLNTLALTHRQKGRVAEALALLQEALVLSEQALGPEHPTVAGLLINMGTTYTRLGRDAEAQKMFERALALNEKIFGPEHAEVGRALGNLGELARRADRFDEAEPMFARALALKEKTVGPDHYEVVPPLLGLGQVAAARERFADSRRYLDRALAVAQKARDPSHPQVAQVLVALGDTAAREGHLEEAVRHFQRALVIFDARGGEDDLVATALVALGKALTALGRTAEALPVLQRGIDLLEKAQGGSPRQLAEARTALARARGR